MPKTGHDIRPALMVALAGLSIAGAAHASDQQGITISPSFGVSQLYTDNIVGTQQSQPEFVTQFSPGLNIKGQTPRANIDFNYQPTFNHFDNGSSTDTIDQNLNANGTITPITGALTVDFQAFATENGASGNSSNQAGILVPNSNRILYYIGTVSPHYQKHYSDIATLDVFYNVNSTNTSVDGAKVPGLGINSTNSLGQNIEVAIGSAESFGRLGVKLDFTHGTNGGSGANTQSTTAVDTLGLTYHISRVYAVSGSIGYQSIDYPTNGLTLGYKSSGVTWNVGFTITPNELSSIAVGYGKRQGSYNPTVQVGYALGSRTNISASYLVSVQNQLTSSLQNLRYLTYDPFGNPIDSRTGLPFSAVNQTFGSQNVLFRDKPALVSVAHQFVRSAVTLTAQYEVRTSLSGIATNDAILGATINYTRQFSPLLQGNMSVGYTENVSKTAGQPDNRSRNISLSGSLLYNLSDTTTINVIENFFKTSSGIAANNSQNQQLTVGLRKSF
jgi:uncharacterized protein (PEP-CTERM system associated)